MHYDKQRENDIIDVSTNACNKSAKKIKVTLPSSSSVNQHLNITWHLDENGCAVLVKEPKESI